MTTVYNLVDPKLNWGVSFHYNPFYLLFAQVDGGKEISYLPLSYLLFCQAFFFFPILVGLFLKFRFSLPFLIGTFSSLFFSVFVTDFLFWSALHVLPMVVLMLGLVRKTNQLKFPLAIASAVLWSWCSGPLAFTGGIFLLWLLQEEETSVKLLFLGSALLTAVLFLAPFPMPNLPYGSNLSEPSPINSWPAQFWGPTLSPNPLNFAEFSSRLSSYFSTAVTNVLLVVALLFQLKNRGSISKELHVILFTSAFLLIESSSGGVITQNLASVMYGLPLLPFPWLLGSLGVLLGLGIFINSPSEGNLPFNLGFIILVLFYLSNLVTNLDGDVVEAQTIGTQFSQRISRDSNKLIPEKISFHGVNAAEINVSVNQDQAKLIADHRLDTNWSSNGAMTGREIVELKLKRATNCSFLAILPGANKTDFPRGIKVEVTDDNLNYRVAAENPKWSGPKRVTSDGLFYYGPQSDVEFKLDGAEAITGLRIYQTAKDRFYYWSVAEVQCGSK